MLLLRVGIVDSPESQVVVSKPGCVREKTSIHAFDALQQTFVRPSFPSGPSCRELAEPDQFGKLRPPFERPAFFL